MQLQFRNVRSTQVKALLLLVACFVIVGEMDIVIHQLSPMSPRAPLPPATALVSISPPAPPPKSNQVIVFSLFSVTSDMADEMFVSGIVHNELLRRIVFPEWRIRIYMADNLPMTLKETMELLDIEVILVPFVREKWDDGTFWRFYVADDKNVERFLVRDIDSRLNWRDRLAVDEWIQAGTPFHFMRDHKCHRFSVVLAGMWGGIGNLLSHYPNFNDNRTMKELCDSWPGKSEKGQDQDFLQNYIYPIVRNNATQHSILEANCLFNAEVHAEKCHPFPTNDRSDWYFVGQTYTAPAVDATLNCSQKPTCEQDCRYYRDEFKEMTGKEFPDFYSTGRPDVLRCDLNTIFHCG